MDLRRDPPIFKGSLLRGIALVVVELVGGLEVERLERWIGKIVKRRGGGEDCARIFQLARLWSGSVLCGGCKRTQEKHSNQNLCAHDSERLPWRGLAACFLSTPLLAIEDDSVTVHASC